MAQFDRPVRTDDVPLGVGVIVGTVQASSPGDAPIKSLGGGGALLPVEAAGLISPAWTPMGAAGWRSVAILAALILAASVGTAVAYRAAPASTVGTFECAYAGSALIRGTVFLGERPDAAALGGIGPIVGAGVLALRRGGA